MGTDVQVHVQPLDGVRRYVYLHDTKDTSSTAVLSTGTASKRILCLCCVHCARVHSLRLQEIVPVDTVPVPVLPVCIDLPVLGSYT